MDVARSADLLKADLATAGNGHATSPRSLFAAGLAFYAERRFSGLIEDSGDMLLFQSGVHDWGSGPSFELDLTRRFIEVERDDDDDVFSQLRLTAYFQPTAELAAVGSDERWCRDPSEFDPFATWLAGHPALAAAERRPPRDVRIEWGLV